jgi:hypothetical protein
VKEVLDGKYDGEKNSGDSFWLIILKAYMGNFTSAAECQLNKLGTNNRTGICWATEVVCAFVCVT